MKKLVVWLGVLALIASCWSVSITPAAGETFTFVAPDGREVTANSASGTTQLPAPGDYEWWYGCAPTSAGMMMGHYDVNGYLGLTYGNLVPGGSAETETYPPSPPATGSAALANNAIASSGHVSDFYHSPPGYAGFGDDTGPTHSFDCLADFMGTSQDSVSSSNGSSWFFNWNDNSPFTESDAAALSTPYSKDWSGMYGVGEYLEYAGYDAATLYNQRRYGYNGISAGFTFAQYKTEIDAGRPVMIHVYTQGVGGHAMYGYGYNDDQGAQTVYLHDTWTLGQHSMTWGGSYGGMDHSGVSVLEITGGVPEPSVLVALLSMGLTGLLIVRRRHRRRAA